MVMIVQMQRKSTKSCKSNKLKCSGALLLVAWLCTKPDRSSERWNTQLVFSENLGCEYHYELVFLRLGTTSQLNYLQSLVENSAGHPKLLMTHIQVKWTLSLVSDFLKQMSQEKAQKKTNYSTILPLTAQRLYQNLNLLTN